MHKTFPSPVLRVPLFFCISMLELPQENELMLMTHVCLLFNCWLPVAAYGPKLWSLVMRCPLLMLLRPHESDRLPESLASGPFPAIRQLAPFLSDVVYLEPSLLKQKLKKKRMQFLTVLAKHGISHCYCLTSILEKNIREHSTLLSPACS